MISDQRKKTENQTNSLFIDPNFEIPDESRNSKNSINQSLIMSNSHFSGLPKSKIPDIGDENKSIDQKTFEPFTQNIPRFIPNLTNLRLKLFVQYYKHSSSESKIKEKDVLRFYDNYWKINDGEEEKYVESIMFGRSKFNLNDGRISRDQFKIQMKNHKPYIVCLTPPPKQPTSFLITEEVFFLEEGHIISFGNDLDPKRNCIFTVESLTNSTIKLQAINFEPDLKRFGQFDFNLENLKGEVIGAFPPLNSDYIIPFGVILSFDSIFQKWYIKKKSKKNNHVGVWIYKLKQINCIDMKPSKPLELSEKLVINFGECYMEVMNNE